MVMLPKAGKSPRVLENLRPIGLMGPPSKALAGALRDRMLAQLRPLTQYRPQFAPRAAEPSMRCYASINMLLMRCRLFAPTGFLGSGYTKGADPWPLQGP